MINKTEKISLFKDMGAASEELLKSASVLKMYRKGEHVFCEKDTVHTIYYVISGLVTLYKIDSMGERKVIFVYGADQLINEVLLYDLPASISCEVFEDAQLLCIPKATLMKAMEHDYQLTTRIMKSMSIKIRRLYRQLKNTSNALRGDKKIVAKLWRLCNDYGVPHQDGVMIAMELTITYLADMIGSKRETVSRQVKMLIEQGLIKIEKNHFIIPDQERLRDYFKKDDRIH